MEQVATRKVRKLSMLQKVARVSYLMNLNAIYLGNKVPIKKLVQINNRE